MKIQSTPLTFIDQTDSRKLEVYLKSNLPTVQIWNANTGAYTPDWREGEKLTLTADVFLDSRVMTTEEYSSALIKWYIDEISDDAEITSNRNFKTLQITTNELATNPIITYICEATYQGITTSMRLTFVRVDTGLNGEAGADFVVEQGTANSWTYRKWNSGFAECWCNLSGTPSNVNGTNTISATLPFAFASTDYQVTITPAKASMYIDRWGDSATNGTITHTTTIVTIAYNYAYSTAYSVSFNVVVNGRWK